ncbi:tRNA (cytidine(56)-2'-O)-methyltransferase [Candidatus Woesearchaeota archaeon]|nr:tRNA (cytidine(56)-2'-O)-methyltransferase [Candidatus Woesearchaeota archaeon]
MEVSVLKIGHRIHRDYRLDTHLALAARAFLADNLYYSGQKDSKFEESIKKVVKKFGGNFSIKYIENYRSFIKSFNGIKVHLTVYGENFEDLIDKIKDKNLLIIVGGEKVPGEVYSLVDYNLSVINQPHSEVSALALVLDRYFKDKNIKDKFKDYEVIIMPNKKGKTIIKNK